MSNVTPTSDPEKRWDSVRKREPISDDPFIYAVKTTGIYCVPGCASRMPRRENVTFFDDIRQAKSAGFRPCKRCRPDDSQIARRSDTVINACRIIDDAEEPPSLDELAAAVQCSPSHLHRIFKRATGVTPKAYAAMHRANRARKQMLTDKSVTEAIYSSGYGASSRFYSEAQAVLGMKPSEYRDGGRNASIQTTVTDTSLGKMLVAATANGLCAIEFGDDEEELRKILAERFPSAEVAPSEQLDDWVQQIVRYVDQPSEPFDLPIDVQGTAFQCRVWHALRQIPAGSTRTYTDIAKEIEQPTAARAVARACATNPVAVAIPCHRVIRQDGSLSGYRWGIERKKELLAREAKDLDGES